MAIFTSHRMPAISCWPRSGKLSIVHFGLPLPPRRTAPIWWRWRMAARFTPPPIPAAHGNNAPTASLLEQRGVVADGSRLVAAVSNGSDLHFLQFRHELDGGEFPTTALWTFVASSADGSRLVAVASSGQVYISTDSGVTWAQRSACRRRPGRASACRPTAASSWRWPMAARFTLPRKAARRPADGLFDRPAAQRH
jgi:hypothetical protein